MRRRDARWSAERSPPGPPSASSSRAPRADSSRRSGASALVHARDAGHRRSRYARPREVRRHALAAEHEVGLVTVWAWDHFYALAGKEEAQNFESTTLLAAIAPLTKRVKIGALVQGV